MFKEKVEDDVGVTSQEALIRRNEYLEQENKKLSSQNVMVNVDTLKAKLGRLDVIHCAVVNVMAQDGLSNNDKVRRIEQVLEDEGRWIQPT